MNVKMESALPKMGEKNSVRRPYPEDHLAAYLRSARPVFAAKASANPRFKTGVLVTLIENAKMDSAILIAFDAEKIRRISTFFPGIKFANHYLASRLWFEKRARGVLF